MPGFQELKRIDVAIGIVAREGLILICRRRSNDSFGDCWEFPGGKCEAGETPEAAVRRELLEELDIAVTPIRSLAVIDHVYPQSRVRLHPFICRHDAGEPRALCASEFRWVTPASLREFRFPAANAVLLEELLRAEFVNGAIDLPEAGA